MLIGTTEVCITQTAFIDLTYNFSQTGAHKIEKIQNSEILNFSNKTFLKIFATNNLKTLAEKKCSYL